MATKVVKTLKEEEEAELTATRVALAGKISLEKKKCFPLKKYGHGHIVCSCGALISRCHCGQGHKNTQTLKHGCDICRKFLRR